MTLPLALPRPPFARLAARLPAPWCRARRVGGIVALLTFAGAPLAAQAPEVLKTDPPSWWQGSTVNPVRVMMRGKNLGGARLECGTLRCANVKVSEAGTTVFADVTIPGGPTVKPGRYALAVVTAAGRDTTEFEVLPPLARAGRFRGFDRNDVMYLLMPDRFANGDAANDDPGGAGLLDRSKGRYYHGGDLAGVQQRLGYLKDLGATAIWMNPVYDNHDGLNRKETYDGQPITDYHGYGAVDFYDVDEHLGTLAGYRTLIDSAHAKGLKVVMDMVANHTGPYHPWVADPPTPTWFHGTAERHLANTWQTWTLADPNASARMREGTLDGWFIDILPDLNQDDPEVRQYLIQNTLWWVGVTGLDGIRQDTWPYVPRAFWRDWMKAIKREFPTLKVVGEVLDGDPTMTAFFQGGVPQFDGIDTGVDALFDFPLFYPLRTAFQEGGSIRGVAQMLARDRLYTDPSSFVTFLGLHDVPRFMGDARATVDGLKLAWTVLMTTRGTPLIYYGDEIGMPGGGDPDNRRDFPGGWSDDPRNAFEPTGRTPDEDQLFSHLQALTKLRAERADLRGEATETLLLTEQAWVYRRGNTLVAINNDTAVATLRVPLGLAGADLLGACATPEPQGDVVVLALPRRTGCVFPIIAREVPGPALGVSGERRVLRAFPSRNVSSRHVEVWLPPGYGRDTAARYPVIYLQDGQNVFDPSTAFSGVDWAVDETLGRLIAERQVRPAIVVAVWNSSRRQQEYMATKAIPATDSAFSMGSELPPTVGRPLGDAYLRFLVMELKPYIDRTFRTRTGRDDTMLMGASMGGVISLYALAEYSEVFGAAASLSTHWPAGDGALIDYLGRELPDPATHRVYLDRGTLTLDATYGEYQTKAEAAFRAKGYAAPRLQTRLFEGADHTERAWRQRVENPLRFLLAP